MKDIIPLHKLNERSSKGIEMVYFGDFEKRPTILGAHRDDHYIFLFQETGKSALMLDFKSFSLDGSGLLYILPGQVHHGIESNESIGWFLAIDTSLINEEYKIVFEQYIVSNEPLNIDSERCEKIKKCVELLYERFLCIEEPLSRQIAYSLAQSYIGMVAESYLAQTQYAQKQNTRPIQINSQFRKLLMQQFKTVKSPAAYADKLNISLTYLNEVVKGLTGFPVSYWIHNEIILEAKRLLYYTDLTVKEVSVELGFTDHTYFSRVFTKFVGNSAGSFRSRYRV